MSALLDLGVLAISIIFTVVITKINNKKQSYNSTRTTLFDTLNNLRVLILDRYNGDDLLSDRDKVVLENQISCILKKIGDCHTYLLGHKNGQNEAQIRSLYIKLRQAASLDVKTDCGVRIAKLDNYTCCAKLHFEEKF